MTDREALDILNDAYTEDRLLDLNGDVYDAVGLAVRALAEKVAREGE